MYPIPADWNGMSQSGSRNAEIHGKALTKLWQVVYRHDYTGAYLENEWNEVGEHIKNKIIAEPEYLPHIYVKQKEAGLKLVKRSHAIRESDLQSWALDELFDAYAEIRRLWVEHDQWNVYPWFVAGEQFHAFVEAELKRNGCSGQDIEILSTIPELSFSGKEELRILQLAEKAESCGIDRKNLAKKFKSEIERLVEDYYWIPFGYDGPQTYDNDHYVKSIAALIGKGRQYIDQRLRELTYYDSDLIAKQTILHKKLPADILLHLESLYTLARMTDERKEYTFQAHEAFQRVLVHICKKIGIDNESGRFLTLDELKDFRSDKNYLTEVGQIRGNGLVVFAWDNGVCTVIEGEKAKALSDEICPTIDDVDIVTGTVGSRGKIEKTKGKVRVLFSPSENGNLKNGEILVTLMTTPEFVPAMRKAAAIVTDEGGVTCHAAIVSRELGIPCVIGTKIATKAFKDGDLVEVDTDKGIVRKMK